MTAGDQDKEADSACQILVLVLWGFWRTQSDMRKAPLTTVAGDENPG
jgi:hypothetical protein